MAGLLSKIRTIGSSNIELKPQGERSLAYKFPDLVKKHWSRTKNVFDPDCITPGSSIKTWWKCKRHGPYFIATNSRVKSWVEKTEGQGCPVCYLPDPVVPEPLSSKLKKEWLTKENKHIDAKWVQGFSQMHAYWCCSNGHVFKARIVDRQHNGQDCPSCYRGERVDITGSCLDEMFDRSNNSGYKLNSLPVDHRIKWRCPDSESHSWFATVFYMENNSFCPRCHPNTIDLKEDYPELFKQFRRKDNEGLNARDLKQTQIIDWYCGKHVFRARLDDRITSNCGCPYCSGRQFCVENSLAVHEEIAFEFHPGKNKKQDPEQIKATGRKARSEKYWWLCSECGNEWQETIYGRLLTGVANCKSCRNRR